MLFVICNTYRFALVYYGDVKCNEKLLINHSIILLQDIWYSINLNEENRSIAAF